MHNIISIILVGSILLQVPIPPHPPSPNTTIWSFTRSFLFDVPDGPLPWSLPTMPIVSIDLDPDSGTLLDVAHSAEYNDTVADMQSRFDDIEAPITSASSSIEAWIGETGSLPDMTGGGDFDPNLDQPGFVDYTAYDIADEFGANIGTALSYARALTTINQFGSPTSYVLGFIMLCVAWMIFVTFLVFAIQFADMCFSVAVRIIELIPVVE